MSSDFYMGRHLREAELALYGAREMSLWRIPLARLHLARCARCKNSAEQYKAERDEVRRIASEMPAGVNWDRMAKEMTANIHLGLAAGECVVPRRGPRTVAGWRLVSAGVGLSALMLSVAWWLNTPAHDSQFLGRKLKAIAAAPFGGIGLRGELFPELRDERRSSVGVTAQGIELRENGTRLDLHQGTELPVAVTLSVKGAARARYVDSETGQVTITSVYAQ